ncbi:class E sortase [Rathayibacter rathayi]|nr:class E sortase [Rathayibacter rathayi]
MAHANPREPYRTRLAGRDRARATARVPTAVKPDHMRTVTPVTAPTNQTDSRHSVKSAPDRTDPRPEPRRRRRVSVLDVLAALLIAMGLTIGAYLVWMLVIGDASSQQKQGSAVSQQLTEAASAAPAVPSTTVPPASTLAPADGAPLAVLYVPRFGADYHRVIAETTDAESVLDSSTLGLWHYDTTQMPGELGNFAVAGHRSACGGAMHVLNEMQLGDPIYVQTEQGWYTYRYRDTEYMQPSQVSVLNPIPDTPQTQPADRLIILITCNPSYSTSERLVAFGVFESFSTVTPSGVMDGAG